MLNNRDKYINLCESVGDIPLFSQYWWLDAVTGGGVSWDACIIENDSQVVGALPFVFRNNFSHTLIVQPLLTQSLCPWVSIATQNYTKALSKKKKIVGELIEMLPDFAFFYQNYHHSFTDWQPFYWSCYSQTTNYTYILDLEPAVNVLWENLRANIRREIKKAEKRFGVNIERVDEIDDLYGLLEMTFDRQGKKPPYDKAFLKGVDAACKKRDARSIYVARDKDGNIHAATYIVRDYNTSYYLIGGGDPSLRKSGATSLCLWHAICDAREKTKFFDFEGSMVREIERFFRAFGARQTSYSSITKSNSFVADFVYSSKLLRSLLKKVLS